MGPVIVDCGVYANGVRVESPADAEHAVRALSRDSAAFCWIDLFEPDEDELDRVAGAFDLHALAVEDALESHQRPKVESYTGMVLMVLKTVHYDDVASRIELGEVTLFVGPNYLVTVRHAGALDLASVRSELEPATKTLDHGPSAVLYGICDRVVDEYLEAASELELDVDDLEQRVFSPERSNDAQAIFALKRQVLRLRRAVGPLVNPMSRLQAGTVPGIDSSTSTFFRDVADHVNRVTDQVDALDDLLTSVLQAHLARVSVQQSEDMRKISAWVAIVAVPTMIAGVYGMNFDVMPETTWRLGYPFALLVMLAICVGLHRWFKKVGWL